MMDCVRQDLSQDLIRLLRLKEGLRVFPVPPGAGKVSETIRLQCPMVYFCEGMTLIIYSGRHR